jgi:hypothetical protein
LRVAKVTLDTGTFSFSRVHELHSGFEFEQNMPQITDCDVLCDVPWHNVSAFFNLNFPHVVEFKLSELGRIPDGSLFEQVSDLEGEIRSPSVWCRSWWLWVALLVLAGGGILVRRKLQLVLRSRWTRQPSGS